MALKLFRTAYIYLWILLSTVVLGIWIIGRALVRANQETSHRIAQWWGRGILRISGVRVHVVGQEHLDKGRSFILMPNHQSHFDIPVLLGCLDTQFRWLAKAELFKIPIFGRAMRGCGYISIDRSNRKAAFASIRQAAHAIHGKASVLIFPEGTRSPDGKLLPFKKGGFVLAVDSGVPILPIGIYGTGRILPKKHLLLDPGPVVLWIGAPIDTTGYRRETKDALMDEARRALCEAVTRASEGRLEC
jgi:1-acyl-sn-glycerol-3-phosphate acyltransferase